MTTNNSEQLWQALIKALDVMGEDTRDVFLFLLKNNYRIDPGRKPCSLEDIENALRKMLNEGAEVIIDRMHNFLDVSATNEQAMPTQGLEDSHPRIPRDMYGTRNITQDLYEVVTDLANEAAIISITDAEGNIVYVNKSFCDISKYSPNELLGQNHRILKSGFHPPEFYKVIWGAISSGKTWRGEIKNRAKDGSFYWVRTIIKPILNSDGKPELFASLRVDITALKTMDSLKLVNEALKAANRELKEVGAMQREFVNIAAHELRTPITPMLLAIDEIEYERNPDGTLTARLLKERCDVILRNIRRLANLVTDILDVSRIENDNLKLDKTMTNLDEEIRKAIEDCKSYVPQGKEIEIIFQSRSKDIVVNVDKIRLFQVLSNLLRNSIRAIEEKEGKITIILDKSEWNSASDVLYAVVSVRDTGSGIPQEILPKLFQKFATGGSTGKVGGTGLGLYISRGIIEAHGGNIWGRNNEDGGGAEFTFTLPLTNTPD